jgi:DNA-binding NtrC family response regulator
MQTNNDNKAKPTIIVIDDIHQIFLLYKYCLSSHFDVISAKSFEELTQIENKENVCAAIMDYHISGESFDHTLSYMKNNFKKAKRILISGHVENLDLDVTYKNHFSGIFSKPLYDYQKFKDYLIELLELNNNIE